MYVLGSVKLDKLHFGDTLKKNKNSLPEETDVRVLMEYLHALNYAVCQRKMGEFLNESN